MKVLLLSIPLALPVPQAWRDLALAEIGGVSVDEVRSDDPVGRMIALGSEQYSAALPTPKPLADDELRGLRMPVYLALAERQSMAGDSAAARASLIQDVTVQVWPNTTHSLPMQAREGLDAALLAFWSAHDATR